MILTAQPNRRQPLMDPHWYKTYQIARPIPTHWRQATCTEVDCAAYARGWTTTVDVGTDLGARQANYIRLKAGRAYTHTQHGTLVTFHFKAGQRCFAEHRVPLHRPPLFVMRDGDHRGNPTGRRPVRFRDPRVWLDDFGEHQQRLADLQARG